jgi:hypothetical protein
VLACVGNAARLARRLREHGGMVSGGTGRHARLAPSGSKRKRRHAKRAPHTVACANRRRKNACMQHLCLFGGLH